jgi:hypothetical protein
MKSPVHQRSRSGSRRLDSRGATSRVLLESIESRRLLTAAFWTGAAGDGLFSDAGNWQGNVAPASGQDVIFPSGVANINVTIDSNITVGNITFDGAYALRNPSNGATTTITLDGDITANDGDATIDPNLILTQTLTPRVNTLATLTLDGQISASDPTAGIVDTGTGAFNILNNAQADDLYTGETEVAGDLNLNTTLDSDPIVVDRGAFLAATDGSASNLTDNGGTISATSSQDAGSFTVENNLTIQPDSGSTFAFAIGGPDASSLFTVGNGTINLGNATLSGTVVPGYLPAAGDVITLISNQAGNPIVGTFKNLPEGATTKIGGENYIISYTGGSGNDVTLTAQKTIPTINLTSTHVPVYQGHGVTFTATIPASDANADTATGTITFYDNGTAIGSAQPLTNGSASITDSSLEVGTDAITATYSGDSNYTIASSASLAATVRPNPNPVITSATTTVSTRGTSASASVVATEPAGAANLIYTWTVIHVPTGAKTPTFNLNGKYAAQKITARFFKDGVYTLRCTVSDKVGLTATTDVAVTVIQQATTLRVTPRKALVAKHGTRQFSTAVLDQFGNPMRAAQTITYAITAGPGSISPTGLYQATATAGNVTIEIEADKLQAIVGAVVG